MDQPAEEPGRNVLAAAADVAPKSPDVKSAHPVLAPPRAGEEDAPASAPVEPGRAAGAQSGLAYAAPDPDPSLRAGQVYFGTAPMGQKPGAIEPWKPGEAPRFEDAVRGAVERLQQAVAEFDTLLNAIPAAAFSDDEWSAVDRAAVWAAVDEAGYEAVTAT